MTVKPESPVKGLFLAGDSPRRPALLRILNEIVRRTLRDAGGREVKHTGDGIMASFFSVAETFQNSPTFSGERRRGFTW